MAKTDPRITLLDTAANVHKLRPAGEAVWQQRINARRYVFDKEASARVGEMMRDCVDLMVDNIEFARTPYPTCYMEIDSRAMWSQWRPDQPALPTHDEHVGFLSHNGTVIILAGGAIYETNNRGVQAIHHPGGVVCGMSFRINRPQAVPYSKLTGQPPHLADVVKQAFVFGGQRYVTEAGHYHPSHFAEGTNVNLPDLPGVWTHSQIAAHFDVEPSHVNTSPQEMVKLSFLGGGDPMLFTTMLLLLNQPSKYVALTQMAARSGIFKGKLKSFKEHHVVTLHLDKSQHVRRMFQSTDRAGPIGHNVGGHWKHFNKSDWCNHHHPDERQAWEPIGPERTEAGDYKRYWCPLCLQRRTWTEKFHRGDSSRGHATTEYHVTE